MPQIPEWILDEEPLTLLKGERIECYFTVGLIIIGVRVTADIIDAFRYAVRSTSIWNVHDQRASARRRQIYFFLILAGVSLVLVNTSRFSPRGPQLAPWKGFANLVQKLQMLPYLGHDWRQRLIICADFKMFVSSPYRFWWLQQWFMGLVAWILLIVSEYRGEDASLPAPLSFLIFSYLAGLATAQCLFFALLLMKSGTSRKRNGSAVRPFFAITLLATETVLIGSLPFLLPSLFERNRYRLFDGVQIFVVVAPIVALRLFEYYPEGFEIRTKRAGKGKQVLAYVWCAGCILAMALHWWSTYRTHQETKSDARYFWQFARLSQETDSTVRRHVDDLKRNWVATISVLGDHPCINALGLDVLLSAIALASWCVIGTLDAGDILKCSVWPRTHGAAGAQTAGGIRAWWPLARDPARGETSSASGRANATGATVQRRRSTQPTTLHGPSDQMLDEAHDPAWDSEGRPVTARGRPENSTAGKVRKASRARSASQSRIRTRSHSRPSVSSAGRNSLTSRRRGGQMRELVGLGRVYVVWESLKSTWVAVAAGAGGVMLASGLFVLGGLGTMSAAVFGAEELQ